MAISAFSVSRRLFIGASLALGIDPALARPRPGGARLIAGTYASEGGPGLALLHAERDGWRAGNVLRSIRNASFGVRSSRLGVRYLLDEQPQGGLGIYDRGLRQLARFSTHGADPCHAALSPDGRMLAVANYTSGSVALWQLDARTGLPTGEARRIEHRGSGPNRERQAGPHAHWVGFAAEGRHLHAVDLGADAIFLHHVTRGTRDIAESSIAYQAEPGSGPRHLARHPRLPIAYLVAELANTVTILVAEPDGRFTAKATVATLPTGFAGESAAAHIALNRTGTRLYVSNRGHDSIAVFAVASDGTLTPIQHAACGGHWPRLFLLDEARGEMLVANERSGNVARLRLRADGRLAPAERGVALPGVVFLAR